MSNDGKYLEEIVHLIEKSISPDARVLHDVKLPILNSRIGAKTQCDIVIYSGQPPRETITLVEVQDRDKQVPPNDVRGWQQKLIDVGAQHLICVSRQEFSASEKEKAELSGNTIRLITLNSIPKDSLPLNFDELQFKYIDYHITKLTINNIAYSKSAVEAISPELLENIRNHFPISFNTGQDLFSLNQKDLLSLNKLTEIVNPPKMENSSGSNKIFFSLQMDPPLYYIFEKNFIRINMDLDYDWIYSVTTHYASVLSYDQHDYGTLAWLAEIKCQTPSGEVNIRAPIKKIGTAYKITDIISKLPSNMTSGLYKMKKPI